MTPFKLRARPAAAVMLFLLSASVAQGAGNLYRYQDKAGNPVISHTLPQDASQRGYEILSTNGRVLERVAPALTEAELAAKKAREEELARQAEAEKQRRAEDRQLLRSYSHPDEVVRALQRKLEQMRSLIRLKEGTITSLQAQIRDEQSRAANIERAGRDIPEQIPQKIAALEAEIADAEAQIERQIAEIELVVSAYREKVQRLEFLTEKKRTLALDPDGAIPSS